MIFHKFLICSLHLLLKVRSKCPNPYKSINELCIFISTETDTFCGSWKQCRKIGGRLSVEKEINVFKNSLGNFYYFTGIIDLYDERHRSRDGWLQTDGSELKNINMWIEEEPHGKQDCVAYFQRGLVDVTCGFPRNYVCVLEELKLSPSRIFKNEILNIFNDDENEEGCYDEYKTKSTMECAMKCLSVPYCKSFYFEGSREISCILTLFVDSSLPYRYSTSKEWSRVITLLVVVCSIPFWPLIMMHTGIYTTFFANKFNIDIHQSAKPYHSSWIGDLLKNLIGYASVFLPIYLISIYLHKIRYDEISGSGRIAKFIKACLFESKSLLPIVTKTHGSEGSGGENYSFFDWICSPIPGTVGYYGLMVVLGLGLQISYLIWGVIQERIMTRSYNGEYFTDSQFLVFINRLLAGLLAATLVLLQKSSHSSVEDKPPAPLFKYSYSSLSNILSSWCQYEALKFVSFPLQILAKASKIIPVMLMGKLIKKQSYRWDEYISAGIISLGVTFFLMDTNMGKSEINNQNSSDMYNPISGTILLVCYMLFDSFTSNWQENLFKTYKVNSFQMMAGVNIWSCFFTIASLVEQGTLFDSFAFSVRHFGFFQDAIVLSICSAFGQVFIFLTIKKFGAVVFIIIMTMRQAIAILLSCIIYDHPVHTIGLLGIFLVFLALFLRTYLSFKKSKTKNQNK